jgi:hypothetical protein
MAIPNILQDRDFRADLQCLADSGGDAHYRALLAPNRTGGFPAYGSHLGGLTAKRTLGHG